MGRGKAGDGKWESGDEKQGSLTTPSPHLPDPSTLPHQFGGGPHVGAFQPSTRNHCFVSTEQKTDTSINYFVGYLNASTKLTCILLTLREMWYFLSWYIQSPIWSKSL